MFIERVLARILGISMPGYRAIAILIALERKRQHIKRKRGVLANIAEFGVANGEGLIQLKLLVDAFCSFYHLSCPRIYGYDCFTGLPEAKSASDSGIWKQGDYPGDLESLHNYLEKHALNSSVILRDGLFSETCNNVPDHELPDFLLIDCDYYSSTCEALVPLLPRLKSGTIFYFDDLGTNFYNFNMGEERFINDLNAGLFGNTYTLHRWADKLYYFSNSDNPYPDFNAGVVRDIPLSSVHNLRRRFY